MKSIPLALTWEFWSCKRTWLAMIPAVGAGVTVMTYAGIVGSGDMDLPSKRILHAALFLSLASIAVSFASAVADIPKWRFTLPVSTTTLVFWPLLNSAIMAAAAYLAVASLANLGFDARWPLLKPTLALVCISVFSHGVSTVVAIGRARVPIAICAAIVVLLPTMWWHQETITTAATPYWESLTAAEAVAAVLMLVGGFVVTVWGVAFSRRGAELTAVRLMKFLLDHIQIRPPARTRFPSARAAQAWREAVEKQFVLPALAIFMLIPLTAWFSTGWLEPRDAVVFVMAFTVMGIWVSPVLGWFLGNAGTSFNISEFTATRPLTSTELADIMLRNTAKSVGWGWACWWVGAAFALGWATFLGTGPTTLRDLFVIDHPPQTSPQAIGYLAVAFAAGLLLLWTTVSLGAAAALVRPWLFSVGFNCLIGVPVLVAFAMPHPIPRMIAALLQYSVIALILAATAFVYVAAWRKALIGPRRVAVVSLLYFTLVVAGHATLQRFVAETGALYWGLLLAGSTLPLIALAAAPLAFWWNRHR